MTEHTATVIPASEFARRRAEREKLRLQRESWAGSILSLIDDDQDNQCAPASPARPKETHR